MNIFYILADQWRYDCVSANGAPVMKTPNLDALAADGMRFTGAYTACALCSPARASIITGLYPHHHGQLVNTGNFNGVFDEYTLKFKSFHGYLKDAGYTTAHIGKWHVPGEGKNEQWDIDIWHTPRQCWQGLRERGIDFEFGRSEVQKIEWGPDAPFCGQSVLSAEDHHDGWVAARTLETLDQLAAQDKPFMLCAAFHGPHFPVAVPSPFDTLYNPEDVPRYGNFDETFENKPIVQQYEVMRWNSAHLTWKQWQNYIAHYWGYCSWLDSLIGKMIDKVKSLGLYDDTVIIFSPDHGDMGGSHRMFNKGFNMYEEDNHIPMIIRVPGVTKPGSVCDSFINLVDLAPTFLEIGGAAGAEKMDGRSLMPLLRGEKPEDWPKEAYVEFNGYESTLLTIRMIRDERWKYVYNPFAEDELYDMESDPGELRNLAQMPAFVHVLRRMRERMYKKLCEVDDGIVELTSWQSNSYHLLISDRER